MKTKLYWNTNSSNKVGKEPSEIFQQFTSFCLITQWKIDLFCLTLVKWFLFELSAIQLLLLQPYSRSNGAHARFVRLPTSRASSVSIFREMSSAFTECVRAPLQRFKLYIFSIITNLRAPNTKDKNLSLLPIKWIINIT